MSLQLSNHEIDYLVQKCQRDRAAWRRKCDHAASHSAIEQREKAAAAVQRFDRLIKTLEAMRITP